MHGKKLYSNRIATWGERGLKKKKKKQLNTVVSGALPRYTHLAIAIIPHTTNIRTRQCSALHPKLSTGQALGPSQSFRTENIFPGLLQKSPQLFGTCLGLKDSNSTSPEVSGSQAYQVWVSCCRMWFLYGRISSLPLPPFPKSPVFLHRVLLGQEGVVTGPARTRSSLLGIKKEKRAPTLPFGLCREIGAHRQTPKPSEEVEGSIRHAAKSCQEVPAARGLIGTL